MRGVAIVTRAQGYQVKEQGMPDPKRVVAMKCYRAGARPLLLVCVYAHAGPEGEKDRATLIVSVLRWAIGTGEDFLIMGDWNEQEDEGTMVHYLTTGGVKAANDVDRRGVKPTSHGGAGKRIIDYGVLYGDVEVRGRQQEAGVGVTHDRVVYEVNMGKPPRQCRWGPTVELERVPPAEKESRWRAEWRSKSHILGSFGSQVHRRGGCNVEQSH